MKEYKVIQSIHSNAEIEEKLNSLAKEGWILKQGWVLKSSFCNSYIFVFILEREV